MRDMSNVRVLSPAWILCSYWFDRVRVAPSLTSIISLNHLEARKVAPSASRFIFDEAAFVDLLDKNRWHQELQNVQNTNKVVYKAPLLPVQYLAGQNRHPIAQTEVLKLRKLGCSVTYIVHQNSSLVRVITSIIKLCAEREILIGLSLHAAQAVDIF